MCSEEKINLMMVARAVLIGLILYLLTIVVDASLSALVNEDGLGDYMEDETCSPRSSCKNCTDGKSDCYWCESSKECLKWPSRHKSSDIHCKGYNYYYSQCRINGAGILAIIVVAVVLAIGLCICCCVCCCCYCMSRRRKRNYELLQETHQNKNQNIYSASSARRADHAAKREEIRRKYERVNSYSSKNDQLA